MQFLSIYEKIAKMLSDKIKNVTFCKIDYNKNELEEYIIQRYPEIYLFKANNKTNPIKMINEKNELGLATFL